MVNCNMDPYDLPEEFAHLQAQDMSKLGFMQDLIRGIGKMVKNDNVVNKNFIEGGTSIERLLQNANTYIKLKSYPMAVEVYTDITRQWPEDYRGWWGLIQANTDDFQLDEYHKIKNEKDLIKWFGYVKQLASEEVYKEKASAFSDFWRRISESQMRSEIVTVEEIIGIHQNQIKKCVEKMARLDQEREKYNNDFLNKEQSIEKEIKDVESKQAHLKAEVLKIRKFIITGWILLGVSLVLALMILYFPIESRDEVIMLTMIFLVCFVGGLFLCGIYAGEIPLNRKKISEYEGLIDTFNTEKKTNQVECEEENESLREKRKIIEDEVRTIEAKLSECNRYIACDRSTLSHLRYVIDCRKCGIELECDEEIMRLRDSVLEYQLSK